MTETPPLLPRDRRTKRGGQGLWIVLAVLLGLSALGNLGRVGSDRGGNAETERALNDMYNDIDRVRTEALESIDSDNLEELSDTAESLRVTVNAITRMANTMRGTERDLMMSAAHSLNDMIDEASAYDRDWAAFEDSGGLEAETVTGADDLDGRLASLDQAMETTRALSVVYKALPAEMRRRANATGADPKLIRSFEQGMSASSVRFDRARRIFNYDIEIAETMRKMLVMLRERIDAWEVEQPTGFILFDLDADADRYDQLYAELDALSVKQLELIRKNLEQPIQRR